MDFIMELLYELCETENNPYLEVLSLKGQK